VSPRGAAKWVALALVGLAITVGVAIAAANLASQQIGIASESVSAGDTLAPSLRSPEEREDSKQGGHDRGPGDETTTPTESTSRGEEQPPEETVPGEFTEPEQQSDDYGGGGGDD
jgi:hypothetical protein